MQFADLNHDFSMMLHAIDIELSGVCNARCTFCPRDKMSREQVIMSPATFSTILEGISLIRPSGPKVMYFCGLGEPLLNPYIFQFAERLSQAFPLTHLVITTNGSALNKIVCDKLLAANVHTLSCSFQSLDSTIHESTMQGVNHSNILYWLNYLAENARKNDLKLSISYVQSGQDVSESLKLREYWTTRGVRVFENILHNRGGTLDDNRGVPKERQQCLLFNSRVFIAANGDLLACCNDLDASTSIGNISLNSLKEILARKWRIIESHKLFSVCRYCNDRAGSADAVVLVEIALEHVKAGAVYLAREHFIQALAVDPTNRDALFHFSLLLLEHGDLNESLELLERAETLYSDDPLIHNALGAVLRKVGKNDVAVKAFSKAIEYMPTFAGAAANLGDVLLFLGRIEEAEEAYLKAVEADSGMHDVWASLGGLYAAQGRYFEAKNAYISSLSIAPDQAAVYASVAYLCKELGGYEEAITYYMLAIELAPETFGWLLNLAQTYLELERYEEAKIACLKAIDISTDHPEGYSTLSNVLVKMQCYDEAEAAAVNAINAAPDSPIAYCALGNVLFELKKFTESEEAYKQALRLSPDDAVAYCNLGTVLMALGQIEEAEDTYKEAIVCDPFLADAYCNISSLYKDCARLEEAEEACREALFLEPEHVGALNNLSTILLDMGRFEEAADTARQAISLKPKFAESYCTLGNVLASMERLDDSVNAYRYAIQLNPAYAESFSNLGSVLIELGKYEEAKSALLQALTLNQKLYACSIKLSMLCLPLVVVSHKEVDQIIVNFSASLNKMEEEANGNGLAALGGAVGVMQPFNLAYRLGDHKKLLSKYGDIICKARAAWFTQRYPVLGFENCKDRSRIRLLIVSGHIRRHSVWDVILHGLLRNIDRERFEVFVYHTVARIDEETKQARLLADFFVQGPADWLKLVLEHKPDIIFYPEVGMDTETLKLASLRLAPLQVVSWGHPITTGLPTIDIFLSGTLLEHDDAKQDYREQLLCLPGTGVCSILMPFVSKKPELTDWSDVMADNSRSVFVICQQMIKFDPSVYEIFPKIALLSDNCCFWFVRDRKYRWASELVEKQIREVFVNASLDPDAYLRFFDWLPGDQFWGLMEAADIFLDLPSFSGYTTAWQAIHCNAPVVTLEGRYLRQRLAAGLLKSLGVEETIASNINEYINIASELANSPEKRNKIKRLMQDRVGCADEDVRVVRAFEDVLTSEFLKRAMN